MFREGRAWDRGSKDFLRSQTVDGLRNLQKEINAVQRVVKFYN